MNSLFFGGKKPDSFKSLSIVLILFLAFHCGALRGGEEYKLQNEEPDPSNFKAGAWTIVVIPDTQMYRKPEGKKKKKNQWLIMQKMFQWVAGEVESRNIKSVVHVGDMTQRNVANEWANLREAYEPLDGKVPYVVCEGNHDCARGEVPTGMNNVFSIDQNSKNKESFGGSFEKDKLENAWYTFDCGGQKFMTMAIEYNTRPEVMKWASKVIQDHPKHRVLITVHAYMSEDSRLMSKDGRPRPYNGGICRLLMSHPNVEFLVCGHVYAVKKVGGELVKDQDIATGHRTDVKKNGLAVHQILFNSQWIPNGGDGYLLLLEFQPNNKDVRVKTFSTNKNKWRIGDEFNYTLQRSGRLP